MAVDSRERESSLGDQEAPWDPDAARERLVRSLRAAGIEHSAVLEAISLIPRHELVPQELLVQAYQDRPLPIGHGQTISQPFVVALMTQLCDPAPDSRVLEVGTGSGYQTAILNQLVREVFTVELEPDLLTSARAKLRRLGFAERVHFRCGDGALGWAEEAPFDAIIVTAAPRQVVPALREQLAVGGRLVIPVGEEDQQQLLLVRRSSTGWTTEQIAAVRFVPLRSAEELRQ